MFGGMHRLHELSDNEKLYERLVNGLYRRDCTIDDVELKHTSGEVPTMSCHLTMPYVDYHDTDSVRYNYYFSRGSDKSTKYAKDWADYLNWKKSKIEKVIFNDPVTVVIWGDGTKTIVRCDKEDFDPEKGLAMAIAKKFLGSNKSGSNYYDVFKKWLPEEKVKTEVTSEGITFTFNGDDIKRSIDRAFKMPPFAYFGRGE